MFFSFLEYIPLETSAKFNLMNFVNLLKNDEICVIIEHRNESYW